MDQPITFRALFGKLTTLIDGGWRITLDVSADDAQALMVLSQLRDQLLAVAIVPDLERK